jgi:hypothetical protein
MRDMARCVAKLCSPHLEFVECVLQTVKLLPVSTHEAHGRVRAEKAVCTPHVLHAAVSVLPISCHTPATAIQARTTKVTLATHCI